MTNTYYYCRAVYVSDTNCRSKTLVNGVMETSCTYDTIEMESRRVTEKALDAGISDM